MHQQLPNWNVRRFGLEENNPVCHSPSSVTPKSAYHTMEPFAQTADVVVVWYMSPCHGRSADGTVPFWLDSQKSQKIPPLFFQLTTASLASALDTLLQTDLNPFP